MENLKDYLTIFRNLDVFTFYQTKNNFFFDITSYKS